MEKIMTKKGIAAVLFLLYLVKLIAAAAEQGDKDSARTFAGLALNASAASAQFGIMLTRNLGLRAMGIYVFGLSREKGYIFPKGEYILAVNAMPELRLNLVKGVMNAAFFFGVNYSSYRWRSERFRRHGYIEHLTFGGGCGAGFYPLKNLRLGSAVWINYDYRVDRMLDVKRKGMPAVLAMPYLDVSYQW
jgi:hypothetical protein